MTEYALIDGQRVALTEWFPAEVKPVHKGVYEFQDLPACGVNKFYRYWCGRCWWGSGFSPQMAKDSFLRGTRSFTFVMADEEWRGLSHPPGAT